MKLFVNSLLLILSLDFLNAQGNEKLDIYYNNLYKAEDHIVGKQYDSASIYYERAFAMYPENFIPDLNNALICAIESDRYELVGRYIRELLLQGVSRSYFEKKYYFKQFIDSWLFSALYEPLYPKIDSFKVRLIDSLLVEDQYPRKNNLEDSILIVDIRNEQILEKYIFNDGIFPTEYEIGVRMINDTVIYESSLSILLIHQVRNDPPKYADIFVRNLNNKAISPRSFFPYSNLFFWGDRKNLLGCDEGTFLVIEYYGDEAYTCCCELKNLVDSNRKKYYLEDLDRAIRKLKFINSTTLPFIIKNHLQGYWSPLDNPSLIERKKKKTESPDYVRYIED